MPKVIFVFFVGLATGYFVAGLSDAGIAPQPEDDEPNAVTERTVDRIGDDSGATMQTLTDERIGLRLEYRSEPDGYSVHTIAAVVEDEPSFVKGYQFMLRSDEEYMNTGEAMESPATIDVRVYKNIDRLAPSVWARAHPLLSNIEFARSDIEEDVVAGANTARYLVDGLYLTETVVIAYANMLYVVTGSYITENDATYLDFEPFLESFEFIPLS